MKDKELKPMHKYNLKVEFENGLKWDIDILAEDITWLSSWISSAPKKDTIKSISQTLIAKNVEMGSGARGL